MHDNVNDPRPTEAGLSLESGRTPEALQAQADADARERQRLSDERQRYTRPHEMLDIYREDAQDLGRDIGVLIVLKADGDYADCFGKDKVGGAEEVQAEINRLKEIAEAEHGAHTTTS